MKKSRIAIIIVVLIVISATVAISFATFEGTSGKASVTIGTGDRIGISIDTSSSIFEDEKVGDKDSKLIPRQAELLKEDTGAYRNEAVSKSGNTNKIALAGKLKIRVEGSPIDVLKFTVGDIKIGDALADSLVNVRIFNGYSKYFDKYDFVNTGNMMLSKQTSPHYLGAKWNGTQYEGGAPTNTETSTLPIGDYEFTILVYFSKLAAEMPPLSGKPLSFTLTVEAR